VNDYYHEYRGGDLKRVDEFPWPRPGNNVNLNDYWAQQGFTTRGLNHLFVSNHEDYPFAVDVLEHSEHGFVVDIWWSDIGFMLVHCPTALDLLHFLINYIKPLMEINSNRAVQDVLVETDRYLFSGQDGLPSVQRGKQRERHMQECLAAERRAKEAARTAGMTKGGAR